MSKDKELESWKEIAQKIGLDARRIDATNIEIVTGDKVICDHCAKDWTDRPESGGIFAAGHADCPDCAPETLKAYERYNEMHFIKAVCPPNKSFADWVRQDLRK